MVLLGVDLPLGNRGLSWLIVGRSRMGSGAGIAGSCAHQCRLGSTQIHHPHYSYHSVAVPEGEVMYWKQPCCPRWRQIHPTHLVEEQPLECSSGGPTS